MISVRRIRTKSVQFEFRRDDHATGPTDAKMKAQDVYHTMVNYEDRNPSIDYYRYRVIAVLLTVLKKYCV